MTAPASPQHPAHRGSIFVEDGEIISHEHHEGEQHILWVRAPLCAEHARAGMFAHLTCDPALPMRRPLSIMRVNRQQGWVQFLYKVVGQGTRLLATRQPGESLGVLGPIGQGFEADPARPRSLLLGGGVGIPPMVFLADQLRADPAFSPLAILGSEVPFPFRSRPSRILVPGLPEGVIATMPLLEDWGIPTRLTSSQGYAGCHDGFVTDLARYWLDALTPAQRGEVQVFGCGPEPMLEAIATLARDYGLPASIALEEYMACAVGGCAGCVVKVHTPEGPAMKRVCVDGPVFDAAQIYPGPTA